MSRARFNVIGLLDQASRPVRGTVMIDRASGILEVRPHRRRRTFELPLATVATLVVRHLVRLELAEKRTRRRARAKRKARRRVRRGSKL